MSDRALVLVTCLFVLAFVAGFNLARYLYECQILPGTQ